MRVCISVGGRFHAFQLAAQLTRRGHVVRLITSYPARIANRYGVPASSVKSLLFKEVIQRAHAKLPAWLRREGLDFELAELFDRFATSRVPECDVCTAWSGFALHTLRRARQQGAMTVVERCSSHIEFQRDILAEEFDLHGVPRVPVDPRMVEKECEEYESAQYIGIPSTFVRRTFVERGIAPERLIQVPYGTDVRAFMPAQERPGKFRVISTGRLCLRKGTHYLIEAFRSLGLPDAELLLVGPVEEEIRPWLRADESIRYIGAVPEADLVTHYQSASMFAMASLEEGMATVIPQAMACALPVVCTTNTGGEDLVRHDIDGYIVPIRSADALAERILQLYRDRDLAFTLGQNGLQRMRTGFTWDDYGDRISKAYQQRLALQNESPSNRALPVVA